MNRLAPLPLAGDVERTPLDPRVLEVRAHAYRVPIDQPVATSFVVMKDRPAVFVEVRDRDGLTGWGEAWCNFPRPGAEYRARLINDVLAPLMRTRELAFEGPTDAWRWLTHRTRILGLQSGEPGPFAQCIAAIEQALWDLLARRSQIPLWKLLGGIGRVPVYASGIDPQSIDARVGAGHAAGHIRFKVKVGFDLARDIPALQRAQRAWPNATWMIDANQAWSLDEALAAWPLFDPLNLHWIEELLAADAPMHEWVLLQAKGIPLAAGENLRGESQFTQAMEAIDFVQPDIAKWGGIGGLIAVGDAAVKRGRTLCPHWLGAGIGLSASLAALDAHLARHSLHGAFCNSVAEVDVNPNPLRDEITQWNAVLDDGVVTLVDTPGVGDASGLASLARYRTV